MDKKTCIFSVGRSRPPHGRDQDHWNQAAAEREDLERTRASVDGKEILVKYKRKSGLGKKAEAQSLSKSNGTT